jgi:glyoxylase-like metal-dependent hydrolase (beta-lactamase superfamily II)
LNKILVIFTCFKSHHKTMEKNFICTTCGVQYAAAAVPPTRCVVCEDERQFVNPQGQDWTDQSRLGQDHQNSIREVAPGLYQIRTEPGFAIGQCAHLVKTAAGNILWDCISLVDEATIHQIQALGGLQGIAISHPHFYAAQVDWSQAFGGVPVYLHQADQRWVQRPDPVIRFWEGATRELGPEVQLIQTGGHFPGSSVLLWRAGAGGKGLLLTGDSIFVNADLKSVSFMYSYPNLMPLRKSAIIGIREAMAGYAFEQIYGAFGRYIQANGRQVLDRSLERYLQIYDS